MRTIVSTIGTVPYGTSKYLVEIIQPTLNKNINRVINSYTFLKETKTWEIHQDEVQVSYDIVNLYSSVPVDKARNILMDNLSKDKEHLQERTKLTLTDIHKLTLFRMGGPKSPPPLLLVFFPCNFYKRRIRSPKLSDF